MESLFDAMAAFGLGTPLARAITFGAVGFGTQLFIKPSISYTTVGKSSVPKQFSLTAKSDSKAPTTLFPWFLWPVLFAVVGGLFI